MMATLLRWTFHKLNNIGADHHSALRKSLNLDFSSSRIFMAGTIPTELRQYFFDLRYSGHS